MKRVMKIIDENNNEGKYEIFCTFDSELTHKSYVIYSGYYQDIEGNLLMQAGSYQKQDGYLKVDTRLTHEENEMISDVMKNIIDQSKKLNS